mmetsp:Transcript_8080/g.29392  ORF Transcript_8080/g.29392 Transcript_8080/m.29392 type:complete len:246 (+) Transcript_8080:190-927(+)
MCKLRLPSVGTRSGHASSHRTLWQSIAIKPLEHARKTRRILAPRGPTSPPNDVSEHEPSSLLTLPRGSSHLWIWTSLSGQRWLLLLLSGGQATLRARQCWKGVFMFGDLPIGLLRANLLPNLCGLLGLLGNNHLGNNHLVGGMVGRRANKVQQHWEQDQAVCKPQDDCEEESLEENTEDIALREHQQHHAQERGDAATQHCRTNIPHRLDHTLWLRANLRHEVVSDVRSIVDGEADGDHELDHRH